MATNYLHVVSREWRRVLVIGVLAALLATAVSFVRPLEYSSTVRLLIIERSALGLDPYTAIRSAEGISGNLASIVYTTSFFNKVLAAGFPIDQTTFKKDETKRRKQWKQMVSTSVARGSGILTITVYHKNRDQATQITNAIGTVLQREGWTYVGGGDLQVKIVDEPLTSRYPTRPNIPVNAFAGLVLGFVVGVAYILWIHHRYPQEHPKGFLHES